MEEELREANKLFDILEIRYDNLFRQDPSSVANLAEAGLNRNYIRSRVVFHNIETMSSDKVASYIESKIAEVKSERTLIEQMVSISEFRYDRDKRQDPNSISIFAKVSQYDLSVRSYFEQLNDKLGDIKNISEQERKALLEKRKQIALEESKRAKDMSDILEGRYDRDKRHDPNSIAMFAEAQRYSSTAKSYIDDIDNKLRERPTTKNSQSSYNRNDDYSNPGGNFSEKKSSDDTGTYYTYKSKAPPKMPDPKELETETDKLFYYFPDEGYEPLSKYIREEFYLAGINYRLRDFNNRDINFSQGFREGIELVKIGLSDAAEDGDDVTIDKCLNREDAGKGLIILEQSNYVARLSYLLIRLMEEKVKNNRNPFFEELFVSGLSNFSKDALERFSIKRVGSDTDYIYTHNYNDILSDSLAAFKPIYYLNDEYMPFRHSNGGGRCYFLQGDSKNVRSLGNYAALTGMARKALYLYYNYGNTTDIDVLNNIRVEPIDMVGDILKEYRISYTEQKQERKVTKNNVLSFKFNDKSKHKGGNMSVIPELDKDDISGNISLDRFKPYVL